MPADPESPSSRDRILTLLRGEPHTAAELAEAIEISPQAVRDQLRTLEGRGWIEVARLRRDTGGKPAREYELTAEGEETFDKPYAEVLRRLVAELEERLGSRSKREIYEAVGRSIAAGAGAPTERSASDGALRERLEAAARALNELGGAAEVVDREHGPEIRSAGCPLSALVADDPDVCRLAEALVGAVAGVDVREACDRSGRPRCRFVPRSGA